MLRIAIWETINVYPFGAVVKSLVLRVRKYGGSCVVLAMFRHRYQTGLGRGVVTVYVNCEGHYSASEDEDSRKQQTDV